MGDIEVEKGHWEGEGVRDLRKEPGRGKEARRRKGRRLGLRKEP